LTVNSWREGQDDEGWALPKLKQDQRDEEQEEFEEWIVAAVEEGSHDGNRSPNAPWEELGDVCPVHEPESGFVRPVPRLENDMIAMWSFLDQPKPVMDVIRPVRGKLLLVHGFADASGEGFGGSTRILQHQAVLQLKTARIGFWCTEISENHRIIKNSETLPNTLRLNHALEVCQEQRYGYSLTTR
jgi:hypothetical protein